jgi:hypothetical protein
MTFSWKVMCTTFSLSLSKYLHKYVKNTDCTSERKNWLLNDSKEYANEVKIFVNYIQEFSVHCLQDTYF